MSGIISTSTKGARTVPATAPAKATPAPVAKTPIKQDSFNLSSSARDRLQRLKTASKDMIQADLDHGLHIQLKGFGQDFKLNLDRTGLHHDAHVLGLASELHTDQKGLKLRAEHGHSEAGVDLTSDGAKAKIDTLGVRLEGSAGPQGVTGEAKKSAKGIVVPISLTGGEILLKKDGDLSVDAYGLDAGVNVNDGGGAHAGYHRFGAGIDLSTGKGLDTYIGPKKLVN